MPPPGLLTSNLAVGLVNIPIRLYRATRTEGIACHPLHDRRGSRIQNQSYCPVRNVVVPREKLVRGFAFTKDEYVRITAASGDGPRPSGGDRTAATGHDGVVAETPLDLADEHLWLHQRVGSGGALHSSISFGAVLRKP
jgi:hypothetical protein